MVILLERGSDKMWNYEMQKQSIRKIVTQHMSITIIIGTVSVAIIFMLIIFLVFGSSGKKTDAEYEYIIKTAEGVHMEEMLTAAGQVTLGGQETVKFQKGKTFKGMNAEVDEIVVEGQPIIYYTDGTHTDAPTDGIIKRIKIPKSGETVSDDHSIEFRSTEDLYLKVAIPEDKINKIEKGNSVIIVVNAKANKQFEGKIISIESISSRLLSNQNNDGGNDDPGSTLSGSEKTEETDDSSSTESDLMDAEEQTDEGDGPDSEDNDEEGGGGSYYAVNIAFENDGEIRPGMSANCVIRLSDRDNVLAVPVEAVMHDDNNKAYVEMEKGKSIEKVMVKTGESDPMNVEIIKGLKAGDKVRVPVIGIK